MKIDDSKIPTESRTEKLKHTIFCQMSGTLSQNLFDKILCPLEKMFDFH